MATGSVASTKWNQISTFDIFVAHKVRQAGDTVAMQTEMALGFSTISGQAGSDFQLAAI